MAFIPSDAYLAVSPGNTSLTTESSSVDSKASESGTDSFNHNNSTEKCIHNTIKNRKNPIFSQIRNPDFKLPHKLKPNKELVNLVTAFIPSDTTYLASSPGNTRLTAV
ncbi:Swi5-dependent recombination DNA repair protein 1 homolog [Striga asiatica]|uniref:Swi5-dependent recombination DNA repair protein 1 homolog n=1 Tax=Striga asiatica TaxID=4170 RepID=A0A5A7Q509_STRAF|nr:Swi5-dependent recombination DNA repair protein 1 homolog [Striga asiatica]